MCVCTLTYPNKGHCVCLLFVSMGTIRINRGDTLRFAWTQRVCAAIKYDMFRACSMIMVCTSEAYFKFFWTCEWVDRWMGKRQRFYGRVLLGMSGRFDAAMVSTGDMRSIVMM